MKKIFSQEHKNWIIKNAKGIRNEKLTELFNKKFNMNVTVGQIKKFKNFHHISSGLKSCNLPIGSERENKGYIMVKIAEPNVWIENIDIFMKVCMGTYLQAIKLFLQIKTQEILSQKI